MIEINLNPSEVMTGALNGAMRLVYNRKKDRQRAHGQSDTTCWQDDIEGVLGEMVLAKHLDRYFRPASGREGNVADVGEIDDARLGTKHHYRLLVHKSDPDDRRYWLITGVCGEYRVHGWVWGHEAKYEEYWDTPQPGRPCYCVPQDKLRAPDTLG